MIISASKGGLIWGNSHAEGGIKGFVKNTGALLEMENGEAILNRNSMSMKTEIECTGTPAGIASKINEMGGGVGFSNDGNCEIKTK